MNHWLQQARDIMDRQTAQLTRLLDDLMDVGRISSGKITLRKARFDIAVAVSKAVESIRPQVDLLHQRVIDLPPEPIYIDGDVARLAQVCCLSCMAERSKPKAQAWERGANSSCGFPLSPRSRTR